MKKCILLCVVALSCATLASCGRSEQEAVRACYQAAKQLIEDGQYDAAKKMINETASKYGDGALLDSLLEQLEPTAVLSSEAETTEAQTEIETTKPPIRPESDPDDDSVNALWDTGSSLEEMDAFWDAQAGVTAEETIAQTDLYIWEDDSLWTEDTQLPQATQTQSAEEDQTDAAEASVGSKKTTVTNAEAIRSEETQTQTQKSVQTSQTQKSVQTSQTQKPAQTSQTQKPAQTSQTQKSAQTSQVQSSVQTTSQTQQSAQISVTPAVTENNTRMQALELAKENKKATALSRSQMIDRIREKGYSASDAVYAADHCGADWNIQAFKAAKQLIAGGGYSRDGLKKALRQAGFSESEAAYAVDRIDVDWNAQAVKTVQKQASGQSSYSYEDLKDLLKSNGFSENEAAFALEKAGIDQNVQFSAAAED